MEKRLYRSRSDRILGGVCGGISEYFQLDVNLIRLIWAVTFFMGGVGFLPYIIALIIIPDEPIQGGYTENTNVVGDHEIFKRKQVAGLILIGVGFFFLFNNYMPWLRLERLWPVLLILSGVYIYGKDRG